MRGGGGAGGRGRGGGRALPGAEAPREAKKRAPGTIVATSNGPAGEKINTPDPRRRVGRGGEERTDFAPAHLDELEADAVASVRKSA